MIRRTLSKLRERNKMKGFLVLASLANAWGNNYEDDYADYGNDDYDDYQSPNQYDSGGYNNNNGGYGANSYERNQNNQQGRIADIPPSKNPTLLLERILRDYDPQIRPNDKVGFGLK